jgi:hypothetical protein
MREIVNIQIGKCGNLISDHFWKTLCKEHSISMDGIY